MEVSILYFAGARDAVGKGEETLELEPSSIESLSELLSSRYPGLTLVGVRFAVNEEFVGKDHLLSPGDVIAVIPPVSGG